MIFGILATITEADNLIVFVDESEPIDQYFIKNYLEEIKNLSDQYNLDFMLKDVREGAPQEITITPQIVFQNEIGKSYYVGRFSETSRLASFIRTIRNNPQKVTENKKRNILTKRSGKSLTVLPVKFTKLKGAVKITPELQNYLDLKSKKFFEGFSEFALEDQVIFEKTNRAFYLDVHPYIDIKDSLYLSYEIYSQFNCVEPVISKLTDPLKGDWKNQEGIWEKLGSVMEMEVSKLISNNFKGDGFSIIPENIKSTKWPVVFSNKVSQPKKVISEISNKWRFDGALDVNTPIIQFNFLAPLDSYAGEVKKMDGNMEWKNGEMLSGTFKVSTKDVTMGESSYDKNVHKKYLKVFKFPLAVFEFTDAIVPIDQINNSSTQAFIINGEFTMMKKAYPVAVKASFEPFIGENGETKLLANVNFDVNIFKKFSINGPDGPEEAKRNMHFSMQFLMNSK